jgi:hypothetical protein
MRKFLIAAALLAGSLVAAVLPAHAQNTTGLVVSVCGTPPSPFTAGRPGPFTLDTTGTLCSQGGGGSSSAAPVVSTATEATRVLKASAGNLLSLTTTIGATSGWVMVFDATSAPADGTVTPKFCRYIKSDGTAGATSLAWSSPLTFATGISVAFSSTGCFTKTASATAYFSGQVQ